MKINNNKITDTLDKINDRLDNIDKTLVRNTIDLEKHMMRTDQNEEMISKLSEDIKPIKKHVAQMEGAFKLLGVLFVIIPIVFGFINFFI